MEIIDTHGFTDFVHGAGTYFTGGFGTALEDGEDGGDVLLQLMTADAHRLKHAVDDAVEEFLAFHVAKASTHVVLLQFVEIGVVGPELGEVVVGAEGIEIGEDGVAFDFARVVDAKMVGVGVHAADFLPNVVG